MPVCPQLNEGIEKRLNEDLIATHKSRRVEHNNNYVETMNVIKYEHRDIYMRCKHPDSTQKIKGHLLIIVDKVVNKTITDLFF